MRGPVPPGSARFPARPARFLPVPWRRPHAPVASKTPPPSPRRRDPRETLPGNPLLASEVAGWLMVSGAKFTHDTRKDGPAPMGDNEAIGGRHAP